MIAAAIGSNVRETIEPQLPQAPAKRGISFVSNRQRSSTTIRGQGPRANIGALTIVTAILAVRM
jgi:hypothetical protein